MTLLTLLLAGVMAIHPPDSLIEAARHRFNDAIAAHDTAALDAEWDPAIRVIPSRGQLVADADGYRQLFSDQFARFSDVRYLRMPDRIVVLPDGRTASEIGRWTGTWTAADGPVTVRGAYVAQWAERAGAWKLTAEAFVTEECQGGEYCRS